MTTTAHDCSEAAGIITRTGDAAWMEYENEEQFHKLVNIFRANRFCVYSLLCRRRVWCVCVCRNEFRWG